MRTEKGFEIVNWSELSINSSGVINTPIPMCNANATASALIVLPGGRIAQFTSAAPHGLSEGQVVNILGATDTGYNGYVTVHVQSPTVFTYTLSGSPAVTPDVGGAKAYTLKVRKVLIKAAAANVADIQFGPNVTASARNIPAGTEYELTAPTVQAGSGFPPCYDLGTFFFQSASATQGISLLYVPL